MNLHFHGAAAGLLLALTTTLACADGRRDVGTPPLPAYAQECGACHVAYPASVLPAASWQRLMGNLPRHFGVDASLEAATAQPLAAWLAAHAASGRRATAPPDDRITRSAWFVREHDDVAPSAWQRPAIKSAANCGACHAGAEQGDFDEHRVRIPR